jgi:hypothetical protein
VAAFRHRIAVEEGGAPGAPRLTPSREPVWYAFTYPEAPAGYLFRAELHPLD